MIRAFFRATKIETATPPHDTIQLKVYYPAQMPGNQQQSLGVFPADSQLAPFPVVIFLSGINCGMEMYHWLAVKLAERGLVVITFNFVAQYLPGMVGLTPGIDTANFTPATYGTVATAIALPALLAELESLQSEGVLAGMLNLEQIILGGHSAGGRIALENADPRFFPQVAATFSYGAHSAAPTMLGFEPNTILPLPSAKPMLLMGGTRDGVIANNSKLYGISTQDATRSVIRTFQEAIAGGRDDTYLVILEGANHFSIAHPLDTTTAITFLDLSATQPEDHIRGLMGETIGLFIDAHVRHNQGALQALTELSNSGNAIIASFERK